MPVFANPDLQDLTACIRQNRSMGKKGIDLKKTIYKKGEMDLDGKNYVTVFLRDDCSDIHSTNREGIAMSFTASSDPV